MAKKNRPPFSNGMCEEEVIAYLRLQRPAKPNEEGKTVKCGYKWSEDDINLRNQLILYWITSESMSRLDAVNMLRQVFSISRSVAFDWVKLAIASLNEGFDEYRDMARQAQIEKIEKCIKECRAAGKLKEAAMFNEQLNKIYGLYTENKKVEVKTEEPIKISFGE